MSELFIATGDGVARASQDRSRWEVVVTMPGSGAQCLAGHPHQPILFAGTVGNGLWKSCDNGQTWIGCHLPEKDVFSVAVSPVDGAVYAGTEPSRLFRSRDEGEHWEELEALQSIPSRHTWSFPPRPWTSHVRWIAPSPHNAQVLLVGIELGGLMYSADGGQT